MTLIKSISGIRGTIGGAAGDGLTPIDIVKFTAAFAAFTAQNTTRPGRTIVVGRDARLSGPMVKQLVIGTLTGMGFDVVDIDLGRSENVRQWWPFFRDRRIDYYAPLANRFLDKK